MSIGFPHLLHSRSNTSPASAPPDAATVQQFAIALLSAIPDHVLAVPSLFPGHMSLTLSALHRVLPYVAKLLAASADDVSDMSMHAAGVYAFQDISIDLSLATINDFVREVAVDSSLANEATPLQSPTSPMFAAHDTSKGPELHSLQEAPRAAATRSAWPRPYSPRRCWALLSPPTCPQRSLGTLPSSSCRCTCIPSARA
ncbi:hypothetical protein AMAG_08867 [Allomyces macrogynus ATCC 38327]|uniref:Uncharacterized protein n=1 Tax=Allomyces macrogynus (strain ATCC 38327) TaxID=578462 RepID=A0A0L0SMK4_ALLM3|nr:hypothetical protein AMAG_08867 [Allomyces macrogynus ATCC 38327]|eukprot:KNE63791.1 hypothetical protein AMAG_08867 [Allomyces macrogynus ATCC 38327]